MLPGQVVFGGGLGAPCPGCLTTSLGRGRHPFVTRVESVLRHFPTALGADLASPPITVAVDRGCGGTGWALGQDWGGEWPWEVSRVGEGARGPQDGHRGLGGL